MAKGFMKDGKFRPTGNRSRSAKEKSLKPVGTLITKAREPRTSSSQMIALANKAFRDSRFDGEIEKDAYMQGFDRGLSFAEGIIENLGDIHVGQTRNQVDILQMFGDDNLTIDNKDDLRDAIRERAFDNESEDRQFSPFEFTAKELNDVMFDENGEQINDAFDAFDEGISEGIDFTVVQVEITLDPVPESLLEES
jgi:hypothetical protein